jgi:large subunit ribosomal protein L6
MSRIGRNAIEVPGGVTATVDGQKISVKGPKGELAFVVGETVDIKFADGKIAVAARDDSKQARSAWGMSRTMVANLV